MLHKNLASPGEPHELFYGIVEKTTAGPPHISALTAKGVATCTALLEHE